MNPSISPTKELLRQQLRARRQSISPAQKKAWDQQLNHRLQDWVQAHQPQRIHSYLPLPEEVDFEASLRRFLEEGRELYAPKTLAGGQMEHRPLPNFQDLVRGRFQTRYPATDEIYRGDFDLIIVPGLLFDAQGYRIGYGGGYYDRFLAQGKYRHTLALVYPFQYQQAPLPRGDYDLPVDELLLPED